MQDINKIELSGTIGVVRSQKVADQTVVNFSLAVNADFGGALETTWFSCTYWLKNGESEERFSKGARIHIEGRVHILLYTGADGQERKSWNVKVQKLW